MKLSLPNLLKKIGLLESDRKQKQQNIKNSLFLMHIRNNYKYI